jgi:macrodomain Ter protein organizer (MatP/YcbG family)
MEVKAMSRKRNQVTVLLDFEEFNRFEVYCERRGYKKSTLIARLIREHMDAEKFSVQLDLPFRRGAEAAKPFGREGR